MHESIYTHVIWTKQHVLCHNSDLSLELIAIFLSFCFALCFCLVFQHASIMFVIGEQSDECNHLKITWLSVLLKSSLYGLQELLQVRTGDIWVWKAAMHLPAKYMLHELILQICSSEECSIYEWNFSKLSKITEFELFFLKFLVFKEYNSCVSARSDPEGFLHSLQVLCGILINSFLF